MQKLTIEQLAALPPGTKVAQVKDGRIRFYRMAGPHPQSHMYESLANAVVLTSDSNVRDAIVVFGQNFETGDREQWFSGYDTEIAGMAMQSQLRWKLERVEAVYLTNEKPA